MKRFFLLLIAILILVSCSEGSSTESTSLSAPEKSKEQSSKPEISITSEESIIDESVSEEKSFQINDFEIIKSPYCNLENNARNPWDMLVHDGFLYVGGGDFDENISPKKLYRYDIEKAEWVECGNIDDEQIDRFLLLGGELYIPGTDPTESWELGNFYKLEDGVFKKHRTIPNGVHCFDMTLFDGKLFASLGVSKESFPVVFSEDNGKSFENAIIYDPEGITAQNDRVYNLFVFNDELFAIIGTKVFRYDGTKFWLFSDWSENFIRGINFYTLISAKTEFCGKLFFTTGYLFSTDNMEKISLLDFGKTIVSDVAVQNNELFVLCNEFIENDRYRIIVRKSIDGENFEKIFEFEYSTIGLSFAFSESDIFIGMGEVSKDENAPKGDIIKIKLDGVLQ